MTQQQTRERVDPLTFPNSVPTGSSALAVRSPLQVARDLYNTPGQVQVIQQQICVGATAEEMWVFLARCVVLELDPFSRQLYFIKRSGGQGKPPTVSHQIGIDGFRTLAERTGELVGISEPEFEYWDDEPIEFDGKRMPNLARVTVLRQQGSSERGYQDRSYVGVARWSEFYPGDQLGFMWRKSGHNMLGKCAEAQAHRRAFPQKFAGLTASEEAANTEAVFQAYVEQVEHRRGQPIEAQYVEVTDRVTGEVKTVRGGDAYEETFGNQYRDPGEPPFVAPAIGCTACGAEKSDPQVHKTDCPTIRVEDEEQPVTARRRRGQAAADDPPPWEQPRVQAQAEREPNPKVEDRRANGLCIDPECIANQTANKVAEGSDRCLLHVG